MNGLAKLRENKARKDILGTSQHDRVVITALPHINIGFLNQIIDNIYLISLYFSHCCTCYLMQFPQKNSKSDMQLSSAESLNRTVPYHHVSRKAKNVERKTDLTYWLGSNNTTPIMSSM